MVLKVDCCSGLGNKNEAVVLGWFCSRKDDKSKEFSLEYVGENKKGIPELYERLKKSRHFFGKKKEVCFLRYHHFGQFDNTCLLGLGEKKEFNAETARQTGAVIFHVQKQERISQLTLLCDTILCSFEGGIRDYLLQALVEGYFLASYGFEELKKTDLEAFSPKVLELANLKSASLKKFVERGRIFSGSVNFARLLGDRPGNLMTPTILAKEAQRMAKEVGIGCRVWGWKEINENKMGLILGVSKGSYEEPRFIKLDYRGGKKTERAIALIGKGVTFDSGGISLKPSSRMEEMKYDMMGAAAVFGVMKAVSELGIPLNIVGYVAAVENMPGGRAQKPGDVVRSLGGKTVEIVNTDAEGRLLLADALEYAQKHNPQAIFDFATLTGSVVVALGTVTSGIMGNHEQLIKRVQDSAEVTGERVWPLPLYDDYDEDLKSAYADIRNSGVRDAGSSKGGAFLKYFVNKGIPWVHCDIAGSAWGRKDNSYLPSKYATGVMVRLMTHLLENWKPLS